MPILAREPAMAWQASLSLAYAPLGHASPTLKPLGTPASARSCLASVRVVDHRQERRVVAELDVADQAVHALRLAVEHAPDDGLEVRAVVHGLPDARRP